MGWLGGREGKQLEQQVIGLMRAPIQVYNDSLRFTQLHQVYHSLERESTAGLQRCRKALSSAQVRSASRIAWRGRI